MRLGSIAILLAAAAAAQDDTVYRVGNGVTPPHVLHKVDPTYTKEAERAYIQGTALYRLIVDKSGRPRDIELLSPIGYGLDEKGLEAVRKWTFRPGMKGSIPVSISAEIEVNFRFAGTLFDSRQEERRTSFNVAVHNISDPARKEKALGTIEDLSRENYPPAMSLVGAYMMDGQLLAKDQPAGIALLRKAAEKSDPSGLFVLGKLVLDGRGLEQDPVKGMKLIRDASMMGSRGAQEFLGLKYETGDAATPADTERARYYCRLCASHGSPACQLHLGRLLAPAAGKGGDRIQALAWLELARASGENEADALTAKLREGVTQDDLR
jgi:TonB family protein